jgi:hypothetical protein
MRMVVLAAIVLSGGLFGATSSADAEVVFSNFGSGDTFGIFGYAFGSAPGAPRAYAGTALTSSGAFRLDDFTMAVGFSGNLSPDSPQPFDVLLMNSSSEGLPADILESFGELIDAPSPSRLVTFDSVLHPTLIAGAQYWIVATAGTIPFSIFGGWNENSTGIWGWCFKPLTRMAWSV